LRVASLAYYESFGLAFEAGLCKSLSHCSEGLWQLPLMAIVFLRWLQGTQCENTIRWSPVLGGYLVLLTIIYFGFRNISESENTRSQFLRISFIVVGTIHCFRLLWKPERTGGFNERTSKEPRVS
jgi:hypothetical protein